MDFAILTPEGFQFVFRWIHFLAGITWIGLLYYFNFVQGEWFKEAAADVKTAAVQKLVPRALGWFRWGAMFTFLSGWTILGMKGHSAGFELFQTSWGIFILLGSVLGTLMFLNVWLIIWPNQKIVIAAAQGQANPKSADAATRAGIASRTNVLFSIPMLFCMGASSHLPMAVGFDYSGWLLAGVLALILGVIEFNAIRGKLVAPLKSVVAVIHSGLVLTLLLYAVVEILT